MKIHFVNVRTMHHSPHSGYDRLMDYVSHIPVPSSRVWEKMSELDRKRAYHQAKEQVSWYNLSDLEMETNVNALNPWFRKHCCHFLYGENSVYHIKKSDNPRKKIFVSFHQPPEVHQQFIRTREPLQSIDGVIVVGTNQIPFFEQYVDRSKIHFVPHGVDTDFFKPGPTEAKITNKIIFVGNWLRDFETLVAVAEVLAAKAPEVVLDIVTLEQNKPLFEGCGNVMFNSEIAEDVLLRKYWEASLMIVPMKDCTANNSVLEAMACGLPIVTNDIGGMRDYLDEGCAALCTRVDAAGMAEAIIALLSDRKRSAELGARSREMSLRFTWPKVADMLRAAYHKSFEA
jgi:glycosyltransferase involved in cell wall biosynthesis